jgi:putative aldouronate transport system permease protein
MGVFQWNSWFDGLFFVNDRHLMPLQSLMQNMIRSHSMAAAAQEGGGAVDLMEQQVTNESLKMAAVMVATVPIVCVYPFLQRYFVKGVLIGSIKG